MAAKIPGGSEAAISPIPHPHPAPSPMKEKEHWSPFCGKSLVEKFGSHCQVRVRSAIGQTADVILNQFGQPILDGTPLRWEPTEYAPLPAEKPAAAAKDADAPG